MPNLGNGLMDYAEECRRKAHHFLTVARQMGVPRDRAAMIEIAAFWMKRAEEEVERNQRIVQQQTQPKKEPEAEALQDGTRNEDR